MKRWQLMVCQVSVSSHLPKVVNVHLPVENHFHLLYISLHTFSHRLQHMNNDQLLLVLHHLYPDFLFLLFPLSVLRHWSQRWEKNYKMYRKSSTIRVFFFRSYWATFDLKAPTTRVNLAYFFFIIITSPFHIWKRVLHNTWRKFSLLVSIFSSAIIIAVISCNKSIPDSIHSFVRGIWNKLSELWLGSCQNGTASGDGEKDNYLKQYRQIFLNNTFAFLV